MVKIDDAEMSVISVALSIVTHFVSRITFLEIHREPSKHIPEGTSLTEMCNDKSPGTNNKK